MKNNSPQKADAIVIGSGMGGLSVASLLAKDGVRVLVLEAAHVPGGCSSSFRRKGYVFESGATTLIGFDEHQPVGRLENMLGITLPRQEIQPSMTVTLDEDTRCVRYKDREEWIREAGRVFGNPEAQRRFWDICFRVSDTVWKVSERNPHFPPQSVSDWFRLVTSNSPADAPVLRYALRSVQQVMQRCEVDTPLFRRFVDEQLMITAQSASDQVPFLFGAAGLTYTNYSNFYVPGGLLEMIRSLQQYIESNGGQLLTKRRVTGIRLTHEQDFVVETANGELYTAPLIYSNLPVWNMKDLTEGEMQDYFRSEASKYDKAWGAFTMGIVTEDNYPDDLTIHHQIHLDSPMMFTNAASVFVSMSMRGDTLRAPEGERVLNISCHTAPEPWFELNGDYEAVKKAVQDSIVEILRKRLPGFSNAGIRLVFSATPVTWQNWVYRHKGRVGGIPQQMSRSLLDWSAAKTPFDGLFLCGDTVYPGQGIPGVTLSGINVYYKSQSIRQNQRIT